jgi:hypothetical protein
MIAVALDVMRCNLKGGTSVLDVTAAFICMTELSYTLFNKVI